MKNLFLIIGFSLLVLMMLTPSAVYAAVDDVEVEVTVDSIFILILDKDTIGWGQIEGGVDHGNPPTAAMYNMDTPFEGYGWTHPHRNVNAQVYSNTGWSLWLMGSSDYFEVGTELDPWEEKPCSDIIWQDGEPDVWNMLTQGGFEEPEVEYGPNVQGPFGEWVYGGDANPTGAGEYPVNFRVLLDWDHDTPGDYWYDSIVFTLTDDDS